MSNSTQYNGSCGCGGCLSLILLIVLLWAIWFGLPTPWGKYNLDIFPPRLWDMNANKL